MRHSFRDRPTCTKRGFTLAEIIASIALIAVVGVFLVQMFATSDSIATKARSLDRAVALSSSIADRWKSGTRPDALGAIPEVAGAVMANANGSYLPVDRLMQPCRETDAAYIVELVLSEGDNGVFDLRVRVIEAVGGWKTERPVDGHILHELIASRYFG
jgi:prepilin-type N-terminal cleavage/methylation domain-containing protein